MTTETQTTPTETAQTEDGKLVCQLAENSRIKIIGLGGIGCITLEYLTIFLRSLNIPLRLTLIDGDKFEPKNAERMNFEEVGNKADIKATEAVNILGSNGEVAVVSVPEFVEEDNIKKLIRDGDYVFLCVDNHSTRRLVSNHCATLPNVALFSGGNDGVEPPHERGTYGNVQIHIRQNGKNVTVPITHYHPEITNAKDKGPSKMNCGQMAVSSPQILFTNLAVASAMLNAFFSYICGELKYQENKLDIIEARSLPQFMLKETISPAKKEE